MIECNQQTRMAFGQPYYLGQIVMRDEQHIRHIVVLGMHP
jgi:hypothetical protein